MYKTIKVDVSVPVKDKCRYKTTVGKTTKTFLNCPWLRFYPTWGNAKPNPHCGFDLGDLKWNSDGSVTKTPRCKEL